MTDTETVVNMYTITYMPYWFKKKDNNEIKQKWPVKADNNYKTDNGDINTQKVINFPEDIWILNNIKNRNHLIKRPGIIMTL